MDTVRSSKVGLKKDLIRKARLDKVDTSDIQGATGLKRTTLQHHSYVSAQKESRGTHHAFQRSLHSHLSLLFSSTVVLYLESLLQAFLLFPRL